MTLQESCNYITKNFYDDSQGRIILKSTGKRLNVEGLNYLLKKFYKFAKEKILDDEIY